MTPPKLYIRLFGTPEIIVQHENFPHTHHELPKNQQSEILLYLLIHGETFPSRTDLSGCLGIQNQPSVPINKLRGYLQDVAFPYEPTADTYITGTKKNSPLGLANCTSDLQVLTERLTNCQTDPTASNRRLLRECLQEIGDKPFSKGFEGYLWLKPYREAVEPTVTSAKQEATIVLGTLLLPEQTFPRAEVEVLHEQLNAPNSPHIVTICGMIGVGKTTLAVQYAEKYKTKYDYVFLASAVDSDTLHKAYTQFYDALFPESKFTKQDKAPLFLKWLQTQKNYLLVLDNLMYPVLLQKNLPTPLNGHLVITTRPEMREGTAQLLNVECLSAEEGIKFVQLLTKGEPRQYQFTREQALTFTQHYGGLPVALTAALANFKQSHLETHRYMKRLKQVQLSPHEAQIQIIKDSFQLHRPDPQKVLQLIAHLAAEPVPEWALRLGALGSSWDTVRDDIHRYALCGYAAGNYTLHRFIRQIISRLAQEQEQTTQLKKETIKVINRALPSTIYTPGSEFETDYEAAEFSRREKYLQLTSHLLMCLTYIQSAEDNDTDALHLLRKGVHYHLFLRGNTSKAKELCELQERLTRQLYPELNREWVESSRLSASLNIYIENNPCANKHIVQARNYAKRLGISREDPIHCAILESRGFVLLRMKKYRCALPFLLAARNHAQTTNQKATILLKLGDAYLNLERFEEGEQHTLCAIELSRTFAEQDKTPLAVGLSTLGAIYTYWGNASHDNSKYLLGEKALQEGIQLGEKHWGESHHFTADILLKQGELYYYQGSKELARQIFERVRKICRQNSDSNNRIRESTERWLQKIAAH
jgi:tetratricopeptide (TPR) repeat protein